LTEAGSLPASSPPISGRGRPKPALSRAGSRQLSLHRGTGRAWSACSHCPWPESRPKIAADYELNFDRIAPLHAALGVSLPSKRAAIEAHGSTIQATIFDALDALDALDGLDGFDGLDAGRLLAPAGLGGDIIVALRARLLG